jgi:hypothetical protein
LRVIPAAQAVVVADHPLHVGGDQFALGLAGIRGGHNAGRDIEIVIGREAMAQVEDSLQVQDPFPHLEQVLLADVPTAGGGKGLGADLAPSLYPPGGEPATSQGVPFTDAHPPGPFLCSVLCLVSNVSSLN